MKRNWLIYLVIFSLALNLGTIGTFAYLRHQDQREKFAGPPPPPLPLRSLWRELNLDDSQRQALRGLFPNHHRKVGEIRQELAQKRQELFNLIQEETTPETTIRAKVQEISSLQGSLEEEMVRFMLAFKKNLNHQQQAVFLNKLQARLCGPEGVCGPMGTGFGRHPGGGRGHGRGRGMGPGMGPGPGPGPEDGPPPPPPLESPR
ncbi:MAG: Spy/CpxP family protein refolding chaperone [Thermodesulfobacteriota bacterium]